MKPYLNEILTELRNINFKQYNLDIQVSNRQVWWVTDINDVKLDDNEKPTIAIAFHNKLLKYFTSQFTLYPIVKTTTDPHHKVYELRSTWQQYNHHGAVINKEYVVEPIVDYDKFMELIYTIEDYIKSPLADQFDL